MASHSRGAQTPFGGRFGVKKYWTVWVVSGGRPLCGDTRGGFFEKKTIVLYGTALDPDRPGRRTVARAHLEENGRVLVHRHFLIDDSGNERMMIELRLTRKAAAKSR